MPPSKMLQNDEEVKGESLASKNLDKIKKLYEDAKRCRNGETEVIEKARMQHVRNKRMGLVRVMIDL